MDMSLEYNYYTYPKETNMKISREVSVSRKFGRLVQDVLLTKKNNLMGSRFSYRRLLVIYAIRFCILLNN